MNPIAEMPRSAMVRDMAHGCVEFHPHLLKRGEIMRRTLLGLGTTVGSAVLAIVVIMGVSSLTTSHSTPRSAPDRASRTETVSPAASAAQNVRFLALTGIVGEVTRKGFLNQIQLSTAAWSLDNTGVSRTGGGAGVTHLGDLQVTYVYDRSVPKVEGVAESGATIPAAVLTETDAKGNKILVETLANVHVTHISVAGAAGGATMVTLTLSGDQLETVYSTVSPIAKYRNCWNQMRNAAC